MSGFGINSTPDTAQNYRGLLVAKITAVNTPGSGPLSGRPVYDWTEQTFDPSTGQSQNAVPARSGTYVSVTSFNNCLIDVNNATLTIGGYVWIRMKGAVTGQTVYETAMPASSSSAFYRGNINATPAGALTVPVPGVAWTTSGENLFFTNIILLNSSGSDCFIQYGLAEWDPSSGSPPVGTTVIYNPVFEQFKNGDERGVCHFAARNNTGSDKKYNFVYLTVSGAGTVNNPTGTCQVARIPATLQT